MTYTRPENGNEVNIITLNGDEESIQILGGIDIKLPNVKFDDNTIKKYVVVENHRSDGVISVDYLYGKIDFEEIALYPDALKECMRKVISRENIDRDYKGCCGALPDVRVDNTTGKLAVRVDVDTIKAIMNGVLKSSHRQIIKSKKVGPESDQKEALYKKLARSYRQAEEEFENNSNKRSKGQRVLDKLLGRNVQDPNNGNGDQEVPAEEADLNTRENLVLFFNTGMVIKNDEQILRYSISQKDPKITEGKFLPLESILMSELDEEKLGLEGKYRDIFAEKICAVILYGVQENSLSSLKWKWPYVGKFDPTREGGVGTAKDKQKEFSKISGITRNDDDDDSRIL